MFRQLATGFKSDIAFVRSIEATGARPQDPDFVRRCGALATTQLVGTGESRRSLASVDESGHIRLPTKRSQRMATRRRLRRLDEIAQDAMQQTDISAFNQLVYSVTHRGTQQLLQTGRLAICIPKNSPEDDSSRDLYDIAQQLATRAALPPEHRDALAGEAYCIAVAKITDQFGYE